MHNSQQLNEQKIIENCQNGDMEQFGLLYDGYIKKIYDFIYFKTFHKEIAEDLTSQTFIKAVKAIKTFKNDNFSAWLYRIARNTVIDHYRTKKADLDVEEIWDLSSTQEIDVDVHNRLLLENVQKYLNKLNSEQREIIILRLWQEMSYAEIAEITGKTEAACKMKFLRTIEKLRNEMPLSAFMYLLIKIF